MKVEGERECQNEDGKESKVLKMKERSGVRNKDKKLIQKVERSRVRAREIIERESEQR